MLEKIKGLTKSRRFWAAIGGLIVIVSKELGLADLDPQQVQNIVLLAATWIVGESLRSSEGPVVK